MYQIPTEKLEGTTEYMVTKPQGNQIISELITYPIEFTGFMMSTGRIIGGKVNTKERTK